MDNEEDDLAARPARDGMPQGNQSTPLISAAQVTLDGIKDPAFDDDAAATIAIADFQSAMNWLDQQQWIAEWQYIDWLYQSPTYDTDWRAQGNRAARISRFNVAKNSNTMSTQVRRGIFGDQNPFILKPRGKVASLANAEDYMKAWTEIFAVLSDRAELEYHMEQVIDSQCRQGTGIANTGWEERTVIRETRKRKTPPVKIDLPLGGPKEVNTWESDSFETLQHEVKESWPFFEYRRLGTTFWDEKARTPNRPDLSAGFKVDLDYVNFADLQQMRRLDCYKDLPSDEDLKKFFLANPYGDAPDASQTAQSNAASGAVMHASGEETNNSQNPFLKPLMKIAYWTGGRVIEVLLYEGRRKTIRNEAHDLDSYALGSSANWWNIENSLYGLGIGRLNAGDQRMDQGVLNEVLKFIGFPLNAPIIYNTALGNAPTQNIVTGLGTMYGVNAPPDGDLRKAMMWMQPPNIPPEVWKIYQLGKEGGEDLVGANATTMQGNLGGPGSSAMRTAAGVNRVGSKADENVSTPVQHIEYMLQRWYEFLWRMVLKVMPLAEIREILSDKLAEDVMKQIDAETFLNAKFDIKILAGQKLAARASIMQLIPFLLQIVQQPQLLEFNHAKGETINFAAIEKLFVRMSELEGYDDIFVPLSPEQKQMVQQMQPGAQKVQQTALQEQLRGKNKQDEIAAEGAQERQNIIVRETVAAAAEKAGHQQRTPLELAEGRVARQNDVDALKNGAE